MTYDLERMMPGATKVGTSEFAARDHREHAGLPATVGRIKAAELFTAQPAEFILDNQGEWCECGRK